MKKLNTTFLLYAVVLVVLAVQTAITAYNQGVFIKATETARELTIKKQTLLKQQLTLKNQLSQTTALSTLAEELELAQYEPVANPIVIKASNNVALGNR